MRAVLLVVVTLLAFQVVDARKPETRTDDSMQCQLCKFIVQEIETLLESDAAHAFIEKEINRTCSLAIFQKYEELVSSIQ